MVEGIKAPDPKGFPLSPTQGGIANPAGFFSRPALGTFSPPPESLSDAGGASKKESDHLKNSSNNPEPRGGVITVDKHVFYNDDTLRYMRILDTYKNLDLGKEIELPRLVLAGDQSCGKSSLLENLTGLPVPITTSIGTRFPIEITLIEDSQIYEVTARIRIDSSFGTMSQVERERVTKFNNRAGFTRHITCTEFEALLTEVSSILGVPRPKFAHDSIHSGDSGSHTRKISRHCLQISMKGKDFKTLSFVDTPGLYHTKNDVQDMESAAEIESLIEDLVAEDRTVLVAVMDASQQYVSQKVFNFADDVDPLGKRTIGVLTKCDRVPIDETDALEATFRIARNEEHPLEHGWFMVKNRSSSEAKENISRDQARAKETALFTKPPWAPACSKLESEFMGIESLRNGLSRIFCAHISHEFPAFNEQTRTKLAEKLAQLKALGPSRTVVTDQRRYLKSIVKNYQVASNSCLYDDYGSHTDHPQMQTQLAKCRKKGLRDYLQQNGALRPFHSNLEFFSKLSDKAASNDKPSKSEDENIYTWINVRYQETKGCEIPGLIPYGLLEKLFEEQTSNWDNITTLFIGQLQAIFEKAINYSINFSCQNISVGIKIQDLVVSRLRTKTTELHNICQKMIKNHHVGLQVVGGEEQFIAEVREAKMKRIENAVARADSWPVSGLFSGSGSFMKGSGFSLGSSQNILKGGDSSFGGSKETSNTEAKLTPGSTFSGFGGVASKTEAKLTPGSTFTGFGGVASQSTGLFGTNSAPGITETTSTAKSLFENHKTTELKYSSGADFFRSLRMVLKEELTHERQVIYEIHDILKAYYRISLAQYTDAVCIKLLNQDYIEDLMNICSDELFDSLSDEEINSIAGESAASRKTRRELNDIIGRLQAAIKDSETIMAEGQGDDL